MESIAAAKAAEIGISTSADPCCVRSILIRRSPSAWCSNAADQAGAETLIDVARSYNLSHSTLRRLWRARSSVQVELWTASLSDDGKRVLDWLAGYDHEPAYRAIDFQNEKDRTCDRGGTHQQYNDHHAVARSIVAETGEDQPEPQGHSHDDGRGNSATARLDKHQSLPDDAAHLRERLFLKIRFLRIGLKAQDRPSGLVQQVFRHLIINNRRLTVRWKGPLQHTLGVAGQQIAGVCGHQGRKSATSRRGRSDPRPTPERRGLLGRSAPLSTTAVIVARTPMPSRILLVVSAKR